MSSLPVIFLAFANDKVDNASYLRNLPKELHGIRQALLNARQSGLCEVVERASCTLKDIFDVFQDPAYQSRIAVFHYGGHANGFSLLLESLSGEVAQTYKDGLIPFLSRQQGLKLVFLNGCSSQEQGLEMLEAGIPSVIATRQSIDDEVATTLSTRFYAGLAAGNTLERSWQDSVDEVRSMKGASNFRALHQSGVSSVADGFPWEIRFRDGSELVRTWNLPETTGNPLFGLPEIPPLYPLPESPFLSLQRYDRKHAAVFFGRSFYIRELYQTLNNPKAPGIILLYGQSGAGKSSLLEAGLIPRMEISHRVCYLRRTGNTPLVETLRKALLDELGIHHDACTKTDDSARKQDVILKALEFVSGQVSVSVKGDIQSLIQKISEDRSKDKQGDTDVHSEDIEALWRAVETRSQKPLTVILDQAEEAFTTESGGKENEVKALITALSPLFSHPELGFRSRFILSYRKEFHPEILESFRSAGMPRSAVFLRNMESRDILEVFRGFGQDPTLQSFYRIRVEQGLPELLANDLTRDPDSPVAPMLQILLTRMWKHASDSAAPEVNFSLDLFNQLRSEGLAMEEFLDQQLETAETLEPELMHSGMGLEILRLHTTPRATSASWSLDELKNYYGENFPRAERLLKCFGELFLLSNASVTEKRTTLSHDTLAPVIQRKSSNSTAIVQRSGRLLSSVLEERGAGSESPLLDTWDLKVIQSAQPYLRVLRPEEKEILHNSQVAADKRLRDARRLKTLRNLFFLVTFAGAVMVTFLLVLAKKRETDSFVNHMSAEALLNLDHDRTLAMEYASVGYHFRLRNSDPDLKKALTAAYYRSQRAKTPFYINRVYTTHILKGIACSAASGRIAAYGSDSIVYVRDFSGKIIMEGKGHTKGKGGYFFINDEDFSADGHFLASGGADGRAILWSVEEGRKVCELRHRGQVKMVRIAHSSKYVLTASADSTAVLWDIKGQKIKTFRHESEVSAALFVDNDEKIITAGLDGIVKIWNSTGDLLFQSETGTPVHKIRHDPEGHFIYCGGTDSILRVVDTLGNIRNQINILRDGGENINDFDVHPGGSMLLIGGSKGTVLLYDTKQGREVQRFMHEGNVIFSRFDRSGRFILSSSSDNMAYIHNLDGELLYKMMGHKNDVTAIMMSPEYNLAITTSTDRSIIFWDLSTVDTSAFRSNDGSILSLDISPDNHYLLSAGQDSSIQVWDVSTRAIVRNLKLKSMKVLKAAFNLKGESVIAITEGKTALVWDWRQNDTVFLSGHTDRVTGIYTLKSGNYVTASLDGSVRFWNQAGTCIRVIPVVTGGIIKFSASPSRERFVAGTNAGALILLDDKGDVIDSLHVFTQPVSIQNFSPDGNYVVAVAGGRNCIVWDLMNKKVEALFSHECVSGFNCLLRSARFSPDGSMIVTAAADRTARIWKRNGDAVATLYGHSDEVVDAFFSGDMVQVLTWSLDSTMRMWDLKGNEVSVYSGHMGPVTACVRDSSSTRAFTASTDGQIREWWFPYRIHEWYDKSSLYRTGVLKESPLNKAWYDMSGLFR